MPKPIQDQTSPQLSETSALTKPVAVRPPRMRGHFQMRIIGEGIINLPIKK